jgi:hypothetical protein
MGSLDGKLWQHKSFLGGGHLLSQSPGRGSSISGEIPNWCDHDDVSEELSKSRKIKLYHSSHGENRLTKILEVPKLSRCTRIERNILSVVELLSGEAQAMLGNLAQDESEILQDTEAIQKHADKGITWIYSGLLRYLLHLLSVCWGRWAQFKTLEKRNQGTVTPDSGCIKRIVDLLFEKAVQEGEAIWVRGNKLGTYHTIHTHGIKDHGKEFHNESEIIELNLPQEQLLRGLQKLVWYPRGFAGLDITKTSGC